MGASVPLGLCYKEMITEHLHTEMGASGLWPDRAIRFNSSRDFRFYPLRLAV
jgi:hypothetical protein